MVRGQRSEVRENEGKQSEVTSTLLLTESSAASAHVAVAVMCVEPQLLPQVLLLLHLEQRDCGRMTAASRLSVSVPISVQ